MHEAGQGRENTRGGEQPNEERAWGKRKEKAKRSAELTAALMRLNGAET